MKMIKIGSLLLILLSCTLEAGHNQLDPYDKIVIYQFGKTGSTSLFNLFGDLTIDTPIEKVPDHPTKGKAIHTHSDDVIVKILKKKERLLVINVVRNLFDRNISHFFHHLRSEKKASIENSNIHSLSEQYRKFDLTISKGLAGWYDRFAALFQIDLFGRPFNHHKKYALFKRKNVTILILRFEDIAHWPAIFEKTLNLQGVAIPKMNVMNIPYYKFFQHEYKYSKSEISLIRSIDFMKHFYTEHEIKVKINRL